MADRSDKKAKQRLKRERKRLALRKASGISPYKKAANGRLLAVRANADWRERGQASVFVLRQMPGGRLAMAVFLVDLWCAGLKEAYGHLDVLREQFDKAVAGMDERMDGQMAEVPLAEAAQVVAGGIRFAVRNGFRLPPHYTRWTSFLGPLDPEHADLAHFGVEGGTNLRWVAPLYDLRRRLIGSTVEEFLARKDVEYIFDMGDMGGDEGMLDLYGPDGGDDADEGDEEEDEEGDDQGDEEDADDVETDAAADEDGTFDRFRATAEHMASAVRQWCYAEGLTPSPRLAIGAAAVMAASLTDRDREERGETVDWAAAREHPVIAKIMSTLPEAERPSLAEAMDQIAGFARQFHTPAAMLDALRRLDPPVKGASKVTDAGLTGPPEAGGAASNP